MRDSNDKDVRRVSTQWTEKERAFMEREAKKRGIPIEDVPAVLTMELLEAKARALLPHMEAVKMRHLRIVKRDEHGSN